MRSTFSAIAIALCLTLASTDSTFALGFAVADHGAFATGRGDAFTATADNPSAIYYNPAGIGQLRGTQFLLGAYIVSAVSTFSPDYTAGNYENSDTPIAVPNFYFTTDALGGPVTLGLGVNAPFGFDIEYPDDTPFRDLIIEGGITYIRLNPVIAIQLTKSLSVAVGPTFDYSEAHLKRGIFSPGDEFKFEGDGTAAGATVGLLWKPCERHSFGLTYRAPTRVHYNGQTTVKTNDMTFQTPLGPLVVPGIDVKEDADASIQFPQSIALGYSFRPTPSWNIEVNVEWTDWDSLNTVVLHQQDSGDLLLPFNYESSFYYQIGATYYCPKGFNVSAGYFFAENSVPTEYFTPAVPDSNHHVFSAGVGQEYKGIVWNLAYQFTYGPDRTVVNGTSADGTYEFISHALSLSLGYRF